MKTKILLLTLVGFLILGMGFEVYAKSIPRSISRNLITYSTKGKLRSYDPTTKQQADLNLNGLLSHNHNLVAYTKISGTPSGTDPYIYISDLSTNTETKLPVSLSSNFNILSWSPQDNYILVKEQAGYVGGLEGDIYTYPDGKLVSQIKLLNERVKWQDDNTLFYFQPDASCLPNSIDKCIQNTKLTRLDISKKTDSVILNLAPDSANQAAEITNIDTDTKAIMLSYSSNSNGKAAETDLQIDTVTGNKTVVTAEKMIATKVLKTLRQQGWDLNNISTESTDNGDKVVTLRNSDHEERQIVALYHLATQTFEIISNN